MTTFTPRTNHPIREAKEKLRRLLQSCFAITLLFAAHLTNAQTVSSYVFAQSTGTYSPITGTVVATATANTIAGSLDSYNATATLPFTFNYAGANYTSITINSNGYITFGATQPATTLSSPISSTTAYSGAISAVGRDLNALFNVGGQTGDIRTATVGSGATQEFVVQYAHFRPFSTSAVSPYWDWSFQIRLKADNTIRIVYGPFNFVGTPTAGTAQVGLRGATNAFSTDVNNRLVTSGTHTWPTSAQGTSNTSTAAYNTTLLPPSGLTYTYTQPAGCSGAPNSGTISGPANTCNGVNFTLTATGITAPTTGISYQWQVDNGSGFTNIPGATTGTTASVSQSSTSTYRLRTTCSNSGITISSNTITVTSPSPLAGGTYTINSGAATSGANFNSFADAAAVLNCNGIAGQVTFNVTPGSGPYNEQVILNQVAGTGSGSRIIFNGNSDTLAFAASLTGERAVLKLNGTDYVTINNLIVDATGGAYGFGIQLLNQADNNIISNSTIISDTSATSTNYAGISVSGSATSATATGDAGNNNQITGNTVIGGYYGITMLGSTTTDATGNLIANNTVRDTYLYNIYSSNQNGIIIRNNNISRPERLGLSTFYGIYLTGNTNALVEKNRIHDPFTTNTGSTSTFYGIYLTGSNVATSGQENRIINNILYNINSNGSIYGFYNSSSGGSKYYHNSLNADDAASTAGLVYGFYQTTAPANVIEIKNNIFSITRGGTGTKYALYFSSTTTNIASNYNDLYVNSPAGTLGVGYYTPTGSVTLADWQGRGFDLNSVSADPEFRNPAAGNLMPASPDVNNNGASLGVTQDILGASRPASNPDMGAYEFVPVAVDAAIAIVTPLPPTTAGSKTVSVSITNNRPTAITSIQLNYNIGGSPVTQTFSGLNITQGQSQTLSFTTPFNLSSSVTLTVNIVQVNGQADIVTGNNTASVDLCPALAAGTYTINSGAATAGSNFHSFTDMANRLNCGGIIGSVVFNVVASSGPYNEQIELMQVAGVSATKTITINGNGRTISFNSANTNARAVIKLNGTDYVRINNLKINAMAGTYGWGIHLTNGADNNIINGNTLSINPTSTSSFFSGIVISASNTSATTTGNNANNTIISNNIINGGYYPIVLAGNSLTSRSTGNQVVGNTLKDSYIYNIYANYQDGLIVRGNDISRLTRADGSTFYGVYLTTGNNNALVEKNRIHDPFASEPSSTSAFYGLYLGGSNVSTAGQENRYINNVLYNLNYGGTYYLIYNSNSGGSKYFHNTISADQTGSASTSTTYGYYQTTIPANAVEIKNNIISITRGGTGTKYGLYFSTGTSAIFNSNNNVLYVNSAAGTNNIGYSASSAAATLATWQSRGFDTNSLNVNPLFKDPASGNLAPTNVAINNIGAAVGVTQDILGNPRNATTPDPGAYEFTPVTLDLGVASLKTPAVQNCFTGSEPVRVVIRNYGTQGVNFGTNNTTVTAVITRGAVTQTISTTLTSGTLASGDTMTVLVGNANMGTAGTYTIAASTSIATNGPDQNTTNDAMTPVTRTLKSLSGVAAASASVYCQSGTPTLSLTTSNGVGFIQWQSSTSPGGPFTDIPGATTSPYTVAAPITQTTYYKAKLSCGVNTVFTNAIAVAVNNPQITAASPVNSCGGPVTLTATATGIGAGGSINWYTQATGGTAVQTDNATTSSYTVSPVTATTYYVEAATAGGSGSVGPVNPGAPLGSPSAVATYYLQFDVLAATTIQSVDMFPTSAIGSAYSIVVQNAAGTTTYLTKTGNTTVTNVAAGPYTPEIVNLNVSLTPGSYRIGFVTNPGAIRNSTGASYPYTLPGVFSITGNSFNNAAYYYYFYNFKVETACRSARIPVQVNIVPTVTLPYGPVTFSGYTGTNLTTVYPNLSEGQGNTKPAGTTSDWTVSSAAQQTWFGGETAKVNLSGNTKREWIVGPRFTPTATTRLNFEVAVTGVNTAAPAAMGSDDKVSAMISADCGNTFTSLREFMATDNLSNLLSYNSVSLSAFAGQSVIIAFFATDGVTDNTEDYDFHLDNVEIVNQVLAPLSGVYTINKTVATGNGTTGTNARNFRTFIDAMHALNERTVAGDVTFNVAAGSGPYTERVNISNIVYAAGAPAVNEITINGNGNVIEGTVFTSGTIGLGLVTINGADHITLNQLAIQHSAASLYGWGIHLINGADNITIQNNQITVNSTSTNKRDFMGIVATDNISQIQFPGNTVTNLQILNNTITGGYEGIRINGNPATPSPGIVITGNSITGAYQSGIFLTYLDAPMVGATAPVLSGPLAGSGNNTVTMRTNNELSTGVHLEDISGSAIVQRNSVTNAGTFGIDLLRVNYATGSGSVVVANNMVGGGFQNPVNTYGIAIRKTKNATIAFNSVNLDFGDDAAALDISKPYSSGLIVKNNSLAYTFPGDGYALRIGEAEVLAGAGALDYNNYYSAGSNLVRFDRFDFATLAALQADSMSIFSQTNGVGMHDMHSREGNPNYTANSNLHASGTQLANGGVVIAGITRDFDGTVRTGTPDIGADEFQFTGSSRFAVTAASGSFELSAYPNPLGQDGQLQVSLSAAQAGQVQLMLSDMLGRQVLSVSKQVSEGTSVQTLDLSAVSKGMYLLTVTEGSTVQTLKIIKE